MMPNSKHNADTSFADVLQRFGVAAWGTACGMLIAAALTAAIIAIRGDTIDQPHPSVLPSESMSSFVVVPWQERYERVWYLLICVAGALGAWAAARFVRPSPWLSGAAALAFVAAAFPLGASVFTTEFDTGRLFICAAILAIPLLWRNSVGTEQGATLRTIPMPEAMPRRAWLVSGLLCVPLTAVLYGLLAPYDIPTTAAECYAESHVGSYLIAPALYYHAPHAVPGLDFESHYGIGHAYTFSHVMGSKGFERALNRYVLFVLIVTILYFMSALLVLSDWLRNPWAAFGLTLLLVAVALEGTAYRYPSNWPVRHPFAFAFLFAAVRGCDPGSRGRVWCVATGAIAALAVFWQTDIGLYTVAAGFVLFAAGAVFLAVPAWRPLTFLASCFTTFTVLCFVLFGPRVLDPLFYERLLEPLLLYGTGFGNQLLDWRGGWSYWYNLAGPGVAIASVGVMIGYRKGTPAPRTVLYASAASLLGLAMLFKWVNRSIDVLWSLNGGLVVAVAGCWAWIGWNVVSQWLASTRRPWLGYIRQAIAVACLLVLTVYGLRTDRDTADPKHQGGSSSPLMRIANRFDTAPNPINAARKGLEPQPVATYLDIDTITFLRANTRRTDRVAVICWEDWNYLAAAGRAPQLHWVQLFLVHSPVLLERCAADIRDADKVFVHRDALGSLEKVNPLAYAHIACALDDKFQPGEWTPCQWLLYRRKPGLTAGR